MKSKVAWSAGTRAALGAMDGSVAGLVSLMDGAGERCGPLSEDGSPEDALPIDPLPEDSLPEDPLDAEAGACLEGLTRVARAEAGLAALKARFAAGYVRAEQAMTAPGASPRERMVRKMSAVSEVACALTVSERAAEALLVESQALTSTLPLTLGALETGDISWQHARIMVDEASGLDAAGAAGLEAHFLDPSVPDPARGCPAGELVPGRFRAKARTWRERHHPVSIEERHARCSKDRRIEYTPDRDGMAWFSAYLPAVTASAIWERATAAARALQGPAETRTLAQLRADVAATLLLGGDGTGVVSGREGDVAGEVPVPRAQVLVTVPVMALLGVTEEPAFLDGYGPIPPSMARQLVADGAGSFYRVLTDPRDGAPLEIGRSSYRLTKTQRQWLRMRDGKCPFPGCHNASLDNEADHLLAWADGGTTGITNLGSPCRRHHRLKHTTAWRPTPATKDHPPGWISPAGRRYRSEEQDWEPPHWPAKLAAGDAGLETASSSVGGVGLPPDPDPDPDWESWDDPASDADPGSGCDPESGWPPDPGRDPELEFPPDPFPEWYLCISPPPEAA